MIIVAYYHYFPVLANVPGIGKAMEFLGLYQGMLFSDLASIPPALGSLCIFVAFNEMRVSQKLKGLIEWASRGTLDAYVLLAMCGPGGGLFWIDIFGLGRVFEGTHPLAKTYLMIFIAFFLAIFIGNIRRKIVARVLGMGFFREMQSKMDAAFNGRLPDAKARPGKQA